MARCSFGPISMDCTVNEGHLHLGFMVSWSKEIWKSPFGISVDLLFFHFAVWFDRKNPVVTT
jgi:hypothetical protein